MPIGVLSSYLKKTLPYQILFVPLPCFKKFNQLEISLIN